MHLEASLRLAVGLLNSSGISREQIWESIKNIPKTLMPRRQEQVSVEPIIIDDAYNANPTSMFEAIDYMSDILKKKRVGGEKTNIYFVLADMLELGEKSHDLHMSVIEHGLKCAEQTDGRFFIFYGDHMGKAYRHVVGRGEVLSTHSRLLTNDLQDKKNKQSSFFKEGGTTVSGMETKVASKNKTKATSYRQFERDDRHSHGPHEKKIFFARKKNDLLRMLKENVSKNDVLYFKGSNKMNLEKIIESYLENTEMEEDRK